MEFPIMLCCNSSLYGTVNNAQHVTLSFTKSRQHHQYLSLGIIAICQGTPQAYLFYGPTRTQQIRGGCPFLGRIGIMEGCGHFADECYGSNVLKLAK